jgi:hypothetical protein
MHLFKDRNRIDEWLAPLARGVRAGGLDLKRSDDEILVASAALNHIVDTLEGAKLAASRALLAATPGTDEAKVPKHLPKGYWKDFVADYEAVTVGGHPREFPEETLARMVHESSVSLLYTPVKLGELMASRPFTSTGQVNLTNQKRRDDQAARLFASEDGALIRTPKALPEPQRLHSLMDALEAAQWAFLFARWGNERSIEQYFRFWTNLCKDHPSKLPQTRLFWTKASWMLAMALRGF